MKVKDKNTSIDDISKDELLLKLVRLYSNEYLNYIKWCIIILVIPFIISIFYADIFQVAYSLFFLWTILILPILLLVILFRRKKIQKLKRLVEDKKYTHLKADKTFNSLIIGIDTFGIEIPHVFLPYSKEKCVEIINTKST